VPVIAGPGDEITPAARGRGRLRASHADRDRVIETLKAAFVQGMLDKDEFDLRVGQTFASRTYAQLAAVTADIPAGLTPARPPAPARAQGEQPVAGPGPVIVAATWVCAGVWAVALLLSTRGGDGQAALQLIRCGGLTYLIVLLLCAGRMVPSQHEKRSGGQPPWRRDAGGQASQRLPSADPGMRLPPSRHARKHRTEAARRRDWRPQLPVRAHRAGGALPAELSC
jgi:hypothetical protein